MNHKPMPQFDDPYLQKYFEKAAKRDHKSEHIFRRVLHVIERFIAAITLLALMGALGIELYHLFTTGSEYFVDAPQSSDHCRWSGVCANAHRHHACQHSGGAYRGYHPPCGAEP